MEDLKKEHTFTEKEFYRNKIVKKIENIDDVHALEQIGRFAENVSGGGDKEKIIDMIGRIKNETYLLKIYSYIKVFLED